MPLNIDTRIITNVDVLVAAVILISITITLILRDEDKIKKIEDDFKSSNFLAFFLLVVIFSFIGFQSSDYKMRRATRQAVLALIITYLAQLDMIFIAFFTVAFIEYFFILSRK